MKKVLTLLLLTTCGASLWAQAPVLLTGSVKDQNGEPQQNVAVIIKSSGRVAITNQQGDFSFTSLTPGNYDLSVTGNGLVSHGQQVSLTPGDTVKVNLQVRDSVRKIKDISIVASRNKFAGFAGSDIARMPLANLANPQSYAVIPHVLMVQQMAVSYGDIFKNIAGSEIPVYANNGRMDISIRGFKTRSQIVDGVSAYTMTTVDPANIEKIEVLRGPSATLFGSSLTSFGGVVNVVTKRPYKNFGGNVSYTYGSFGLNRLTADINTPLDKKHTVLFRINAAAESSKSWLDAGFAKSIFVAPSLTWNINNHLSLDVDLTYYDRKATSPFWLVPYKKSAIKDVRDLPFDFSHAYANNDVFYTGKQLNFRTKLNEKIGHYWTGHTILAATSNKIDGNRTSLSGLTDSTLTHGVDAGPAQYNTIELQQNFLNERDMGQWHNKLLLGVDFYHYANSQTSGSAKKIDTINFITNQTLSRQSFTAQSVSEALAQTTFKKTSSRQNTFSTYVSDVVSLNKRWFLMAGLRLDRFQNEGVRNETNNEVAGVYGQTALSPKVGLVYQPIREKLSLFANYMNGFENVNGSDYEGHAFRPEHANQLEAGIKIKLLNGRLVSTVSAYNIQVSNMLRDDPEHDEFSVQDGTELSRGIDFNVAYHPIQGLNITAGYSYNYCVYQKAGDGLEGLRPDGAGPQNTAHLWASYQLTKGPLKGLGIGAGGIFGTNLETIKHLPTYYVPGYRVVDATIFYQRQHIRVGLKVNNLTNERYWDNRLGIQEPRNFAANLTVLF